MIFFCRNLLLVNSTIYLELCNLHDTYITFHFNYVHRWNISLLGIA